VGNEATHSVRRQAEDVLHIIQFGSKRKEICDGVRREDIKRDELTFKLDELHILALKPAIMAIESESGEEIGRMKAWAMSTPRPPGAYGPGGRPGPLRLHCIEFNGTGLIVVGGVCG
jgi:hypothetical protein